MADNVSITAEAQQLQQQFENIYLEYQTVLESSQSMAPKDINTKKVDTTNSADNVDENDLEGLLFAIAAIGAIQWYSHTTE